MAPATRHGASLRSRPAPRQMQQSRSKLSASHQTRREESWEVLDDSAQDGNDTEMRDYDGMDVNDQDPTFTSSSTRRKLYPLQGGMDVLGRQTEAFAEALDRHDGKQQIDQAGGSDRLNIGLRVVSDFEKVARDTVEVLHSRHGEAEREELSKSWRQRATNPSESLRSDRNQRVVNGSIQSDTASSETSVADLTRWKAELRTWRLVEKLILNNIRYLGQGEEASQSAIETPPSRFEADGESWATFISSSENAGRSQIIVKWLEESAEETGNDIELIEEEVDGAIGSYGFWNQGWMDTRERLKGEKRLHNWNANLESDLPVISTSDGTELMVTQLDPDAVTRQNRHLQAADIRHEQLFWMMCWEMLRRGETMDHIRSWCEERNEFSRAWSIGAQPSGPQKPSHATSIVARFRWRIACRKTARNGGVNDYERAVFALLSGDLKPAERICKTWEDLVFTHYNSFLLRRYESFVRDAHSKLLPGDETWDGVVAAGLPSAEEVSTTAEKLISASQNVGPGDREQIKSLRMIQASLIVGNLSRFIYTQGLALSNKSRASKAQAFKDLVVGAPSRAGRDPTGPVTMSQDEDSLRVLVHLYLVFRRLKLFKEDTPQDGDGPVAQDTLVRDNILGAYIYSLRSASKLTLIPLYASKMENSRGEQAMGSVLQDVENERDRQILLKLMKNYEFDVPNVLEYQYTNALQNSPLVSHKDKNKPFPQMTFPSTPKRLLEATSEDQWPKMRISKHGKRDLEAYEQALISSVEWYYLLDDHLGETFAVMTDLAVRFLLGGRLSAAVSLFERLPPSEVSRSRTQYPLKRPVNTMEVDEDELEGQRTRASHTRSKSSRDGLEARSQMPEQENWDLIEQLKRRARTYFELAQLVDAMKALWQWRDLEDELLSNKSLNTSQSRSSAKDAMKELQAAMAPLLQNFLLNPSHGTLNHRSAWGSPVPELTLMTADIQQPEAIEFLRLAYLPEAILAYNSALHCAAHVASRERLLDSLDLATKVAGEDALARCFKQTGRVRELVDSFALTGKAMFKLNENVGKKAGKKDKDKAGRTLAIWDVTG